MQISNNWIFWKMRLLAIGVVGTTENELFGFWSRMFNEFCDLCELVKTKVSTNIGTTTASTTASTTTTTVATATSTTTTTTARTTKVPLFFLPNFSRNFVGLAGSPKSVYVHRKFRQPNFAEKKLAKFCAKFCWQKPFHRVQNIWGSKSGQMDCS